MEKQSIKLNRKILSKEKESKISLDVIVPDIKPDIVAILNTNANAYIYKEEITKSRIRLDGNIDSYVIYLSESGETRSLAVNLDFIETLEDEKIMETMRCKSNVNIKNIETKILNERKINVTATLILSSEFYQSSDIEFLRATEEDKNIQKMEKSYNLKQLVGVNNSKASVKEDIQTERAVAISEILKTEVNISNIENKISYNKVLAKADANIKIVYQTEDMQVEVLKATYPVMSFVDIENVTETQICETEFKLRNMLFKASLAESNKVTVQIDFETFVEVYQSQEITIIQDMYSLDKEISFSRKEIDVLIESQQNQEIIKVNEKVSIEDITKIVDISSRVNVVNKTISATYTNYELDAVLDIMYEADNKAGINSKTVSFPVIAKLETENSSGIVFEIVNQNFNLENEQLICDLDVECKTCSDKSKKVSVLENVEEKECDNKNEYSMVVYFVKPCDTIWKIAKMFKVTTDSIIQANNIENPDKINIGEKLYIVK